MAQENLTAALIQNRLDYGTYEAVHTRDVRRVLFRSHETMYKIYEVDGGAEVMGWYRCIRCHTLIYCVTRDGTKPLNSHAEKKCPAILVADRGRDDNPVQANEQMVAPNQPVNEELPNEEPPNEAEETQPATQPATEVVSVIFICLIIHFILLGWIYTSSEFFCNCDKQINNLIDYFYTASADDS